MKTLLVVSGSIACYKSFDVLRSLLKQGDSVQIILTRGAERFLRPEMFSYLGATKVYTSSSDFDSTQYQNKQDFVLHINLARWADKVLVIGASANTLAKMSQGLADDLWGCVFLSLKKTPVLIFPAMNTHMLQHPLTQKNIETLSTLKNVWICPPATGKQVCGDEGQGKLPSVESIVALSEAWPRQQREKKVLITTGATVAPLDPVRFLTNSSSGKTGLELAISFLSEGYTVYVLATSSSTSKLDELTSHPHFQLQRIRTTKEARDWVLTNIKDYDLYISSAAFCDIEFDVQNQKMKKEGMSSSLPVQKAPDILAEVLKSKPSHLRVIGFAAETSLEPKVYEEKIQRKRVDLLVGNKVDHGLMYEGEKNQQAQGFGQISNQYIFIDSEGMSAPQTLSKRDLGEVLVRWYEKQSN